MRSGRDIVIATISHERRELAIELVRKGHAITFISRKIGIGRDSLRRLINHIEDKLLLADPAQLRSDEKIALEWYQRFADAWAEEGMELERKVAAATTPIWNRDAWLLERRHPHAYGNRNAVELTGAEGGPVNVTASIIELPARDVDPEPGPADAVPEEPGE